MLFLKLFILCFYVFMMAMFATERGKWLFHYLIPKAIKNNTLKFDKIQVQHKMYCVSKMHHDETHYDVFKIRLSFTLFKLVYVLSVLE